MNVTCTQCHMVIGIEDAKVPSSPFSIKCPRCRETITVKPPPKEEPTLAARGMPQGPPAGQDAMALLSELFSSIANKGAADAAGTWTAR